MNKSPMTPDENRIEELLAKIQPVPSPRFHQKMKQAVWQAEEKQAVKTLRRKLVFAAITVVILTGLFVTPQGRAWAQEVFQFFRKVNFTSIPVSEEERSWMNQPAKQYELPLVQVLLPTLTPEMASLPECKPETIQSYACQVAYAENRLGLDLKEFPRTPENWIFKEIKFDAAAKHASIVYTHYSEHGGDFVLRQGNGEFQSNYWDVVPASEVEAVKVGSYTGEFVSGLFTYTEGDTVWRWETDDSHLRLAWGDGVRWYYLELFPPSPGYISRDDFVALAASLVDQPLEVADPLNPESLSSIADAESYSGLDLKAPTILPLGYEFSYARYFPVNQEVHIHYDEGADDLVIYEWTGEPEDLAAMSKIYGDHEFVKVGDQPALYGVPAAVPQYESTYLLLAWHENGMNYRIYFYFNPDWGGGLLNKEKMIAIAESMSDINDLKADGSRPYEYLPLYEQALDFDMKEFPNAPDGWSFSDVRAFAQPKCITLFYSAEKENGSLYLQQCITDSDPYYDQRNIPRNAVERVKIGENDGQYILGKLDVDENGKTFWDIESPFRTLRWQQNGYWMHITLSGDSTVLYAKEDLIAYAESLR